MGMIVVLNHARVMRTVSWGLPNVRQVLVIGRLIIVCIIFVVVGLVEPCWLHATAQAQHPVHAIHYLTVLAVILACVMKVAPVEKVIVVRVAFIRGRHGVRRKDAVRADFGAMQANAVNCAALLDAAGYPIALLRLIAEIRMRVKTMMLAFVCPVPVVWSLNGIVERWRLVCQIAQRHW